MENLKRIMKALESEEVYTLPKGLSREESRQIILTNAEEKIMNDKFELGEWVYLIDFLTVFNVWRIDWDDSSHVKEFHRKGLIYRNKEDAAKAAKKMLDALKDTVNGRLGLGELAYLIEFDEKDNAEEILWDNCHYLRVYERKGLIFRNREDAKKAAKKMLAALKN